MDGSWKSSSVSDTSSKESGTGFDSGRQEGHHSATSSTQTQTDANDRTECSEADKLGMFVWCLLCVKLNRRQKPEYLVSLWRENFMIQTVK